MGKKTDEEFLYHLRESAPEILEANIDFDKGITRVLNPKRKGTLKKTKSTIKRDGYSKGFPKRKRQKG